MKKIYALLFLGLIQAVSLDAYIYHAVVMRKWQVEQSRFHYFIGLGDFHNKQHSANQQHLTELQDLFASSCQDSLKILTEDLSVANNIGRRGAQGFSINSRGGLLGGLTDVCRGFGICTTNLEYRYARVCALGPALNNSDSKLCSFAPMHKLSIGDLSAEIYTELDLIAKFKDGSLLQPWYASCVRDVEKKMALFNWRANQATTVAAYVSRTKKPLGSFLQNLLTFDACLLDVKIVHEIMQHTDVKRTCVVAGGSHIERVSKVLKKIGYVSVLHAESEGAGASTIDAGSASYACEQVNKPVPISLSLLKSFFS